MQIIKASTNHCKTKLQDTCGVRNDSVNQKQAETLYFIVIKEIMKTMPTGCKNIICYMQYLACKWGIIKNAKVFLSYVKYLRILPRLRNCKILIGLCKLIFMNRPIRFLDRGN